MFRVDSNSPDAVNPLVFFLSNYARHFFLCLGNNMALYNGLVSLQVGGDGLPFIPCVANSSSVKVETDSVYFPSEKSEMFPSQKRMV